jgi:hypothetical protein
MEIINEKEKINLNEWMEKVKDPSGFIKWGYMCAWN